VPIPGWKGKSGRKLKGKKLPRKKRGGPFYPEGEARPPTVGEKKKEKKTLPQSGKGGQPTIHKQNLSEKRGKKKRSGLVQKEKQGRPARTRRKRANKSCTSPKKENSTRVAQGEDEKKEGGILMRGKKKEKKRRPKIIRKKRIELDHTWTAVQPGPAEKNRKPSSREEEDCRRRSQRQGRARFHGRGRRRAGSAEWENDRRSIRSRGKKENPKKRSKLEETSTKGKEITGRV